MQSISTKELISLIDTAPETLELIDVRNQNEYDAVRLRDTKLIPLHLLPLQIDDIDTQKKVVFICRSGGRSGQATTFAEWEGIKWYNLSGGMNAVEKEYESRVIRGAKKGLFGLF
jgi:rhodanese-related sulfurtransferase